MLRSRDVGEVGAGTDRRRRNRRHGVRRRARAPRHRVRPVRAGRAALGGRLRPRPAARRRAGAERSSASIESLFAGAAPFRRFRIASARGRDLAEVDFSRVFESVGAAGYVMRRASLHEALRSPRRPRLRSGSGPTWPASKTRAGRGAARARASAARRVERRASLVGADGLNSVVREHVLGDGPPRYAGETIFRGIAEHDARAAGALARALRPAAAVPPTTSSSRAASTGGRLRRCRRARRSRSAAAATTSPRLSPAGRSGSRSCTGRPRRRRSSRTTSTTADPPAAGTAARPSCSAMPPTRRRPTWGKGRAWRSRTRSCWRAAWPGRRGRGRRFCAYRSARAARTSRTVRLSRLWGGAGMWQRPLAVRARDARPPGDARGADAATGADAVPLHASVARRLRRPWTVAGTRGPGAACHGSYTRMHD